MSRSNTFPRIAVHVVTFNNRETIVQCLRSVPVRECTASAAEVTLRVWDNASADGTPAAVRESGLDIADFTPHSENIGFSRAHNILIERAIKDGADIVCLLNPDAGLTEGTIETAISAFEADPSVGAVTPLIMRAGTDLKLPENPFVDGAGMIIRPEFRHFDRGAGQELSAQFEQRGYVFGGTGAVLFLRKEAIEALASHGLSPHLAPPEVLDDDFFAYREDADLAFRLHRLGWRVLYEPAARAVHIRRVTPEKRASLPSVINALGVQNRFFLQEKHLSPALPETWIPTAWRNILVIGACLLKEHSSLKALGNAVVGLPRMLRKRSRIKARSRDGARSLARFLDTPVVPALGVPVTELPQSASLTVIIVNYNSGARLKRCVESVLASTKNLAPFGASPLTSHIVVVDNRSTDDSLSSLDGVSGNDVEIFRLEQNIGFGPAINLAAGVDASSFLLILNPDVELNASALNLLIASMLRYPSLGACGPVLTNSDGSPQYGFTARRFPGGVDLVAELLLRPLWPSNPFSHSYRYLDNRCLESLLNGSSPEELRQVPYIVEQPAGACLLVRRSAFEEAGGFDERFTPAWFEDVDFCLSLNNLFWALAVIPGARVVHEGGYSVRAIGRSRFFALFFVNMARFADKHFGRAARISTKLAILLATLGRLPGLLLAEGTSAMRLVEAARQIVSKGIEPATPQPK